MSETGFANAHEHEHVSTSATQRRFFETRAGLLERHRLSASVGPAGQRPTCQQLLSHARLFSLWRMLSVENAVCKDSYRRQCRCNRLLGSLPALTSVRILTDSVLSREDKCAWALGYSSTQQHRWSVAGRGLTLSCHTMLQSHAEVQDFGSACRAPQHAADLIMQRAGGEGGGAGGGAASQRGPAATGGTEPLPCSRSQCRQMHHRQWRRPRSPSSRGRQPT